MDLTTWPQISTINQKNYYTEYLKRDDQILPLRLIQEARRSVLADKMIARERDRNFPQPNEPDADGQDVDMDDEGIEDGAEAESDQDISGSKVIVIHPGSQNLRIGLASDALPKTVPMAIARRWKNSESEEDGGEPSPKRRRLDDGTPMEHSKMFGDDFAKHYNQMCADLKIHMRTNKRRVLPNSKELIVNYNKRAPPDEIPTHNDPMQIDWTEIPKDPKDAPGFVCGKEALRIPDNSNPRYRLFWPMKHGWLNEADYKSKRDLYEDFSTIIEEAIKSQLGLRKKRDWGQYSCVFVIPDLYERDYVTSSLDMLMRDFGFKQVSLIQESLGATFGAGLITCCVVDVGSQKTSICCVEEGLCIENSRLNLKYGGADVTETFIKMMLFDHFPYEEIDLRRRYDFLLAEELKAKVCTMNEQDISPQLFDFHLRAFGQDTRKYNFKTYDEVLLAPQGYYEPSLFGSNEKLKGRRKLIGPSRDLYDDSYNDPTSAAQSSVVELIAPPLPANAHTNGDGANGMSTPAGEKKSLNLLPKFAEAGRASASAVGTPAPDDDDTAMPAEDEKAAESDMAPSLRDDVLPVMPLDQAILTSIYQAARGDERKMREYVEKIMVIGGGAQIPGFHAFLEQRLKESRPGWAKDILIGAPPRELDPQFVIWKGGSIFGKLRSSSDSWIGRMEYDRLGARLLAYKCMWAW